MKNVFTWDLFYRRDNKRSRDIHGEREISRISPFDAGQSRILLEEVIF